MTDHVQYQIHTGCHKNYFVMDWSRLQTGQLSPRAGRPEGLVELSTVEVWTKPMFCTALGHQLGMTFTQMINNTTRNQKLHSKNTTRYIYLHRSNSWQLITVTQKLA